MSGLILLRSFCLLAVATHTSVGWCGPNQVFSECASPCPTTCSNLYDPVSCPTECVAGCRCIAGYALFDGVCIPKENCPPASCDGNKTFQVENIYVRTCDKINLNPTYPNCYCAEGYLWNRWTEECVLPNDCPVELKCNRDEQEDDCVTPCPATCLDPNPPICKPLRCEKGCVCKPPLLRNTETGFCVNARYCSDSSDSNSINT